MIFYLHYILMTSGLSGTSVLLAVFLMTYTDASKSEIGMLLMTFPFVSLFIKPLFCSIADRKQAHKRYLILALIVELIGYSTFAVIPFFQHFYEHHPRIVWYMLVAGCHVGNGGLGVAWSLGDCLAVNMSQKNGTPFGRMRLMGTISWGVYGFIIGQINETPFLPKYVPAFLILIASIVAEIVLVLCWNNEDFEMVDPTAKLTKQTAVVLTSNDTDTINTDQVGSPKQLRRQVSDFVDSTPSSLGGTLRLNAKAARIFQEAIAPEDLQKQLKDLANGKEREMSPGSTLSNGLGGPGSEAPPQATSGLRAAKNPQFVLLKMIVSEDGRVIKYIILFSIFGLLLAPMNFVFLSIEGVCSKRGYNFSQLAGAVLISQASIETIAFLVMPWSMGYISRSVQILFGLLVMVLRYGFYAGWYYTDEVSPYWAVISEWGLGIAYGIACTIQADVALMFANQSRLFIPELRALGYLSDASKCTKEQIEDEEKSIKMALRATIQALFDGFMTGLGNGFGALICGIFIELFSYISLWKMFCLVSASAIVLQQLVELTRSRWSDSYRPREGTKAFEIMLLTKAMESAKRSSDNVVGH